MKRAKEKSRAKKMRTSGFRRVQSLLVLAAVLAAQLACPLPARAAVAVYSPAQTALPILTAAASQNQMYYDDYTQGVFGFMNAISQFTGGALSYFSEKKQFDATYTRVLETLDPALEQIRQSGGLQISISMNLANKVHTHGGSLFRVTQYATYQVGLLSSDYYDAATRNSVYKANVRMFGDGGWNDDYRSHGKYKYSDVSIYAPLHPLAYPNHKFRIRLEIYQGGHCAEAVTRFANPSLSFADAKAPQPQRAFVTRTNDPAGAQVAGVSKGETAYIHIEYDEPIRFSDNNANHNVFIELAVKDLATGMDMQTNIPTAQLVKVSDRFLTFAYTAPQGSVDWAIKGIRGMKEGAQSVLAASGKPFTLLHNFGGGTYSNTAYRSQYNDLFTVSSLITDLAGNPAPDHFGTWAGDVAIDTIAPKVESVHLEVTTYRVGIGSHWQDNASPYIGPYNTLVTPVVTFSEVLAHDRAASGKYFFDGMTAELNVVNGRGETMTATADYGYTETPVNGRPRTVVRFEGMQNFVGSQMESGAQNSPVAIKYVRKTGGLTDSSGNVFAQNNPIGVSPAQQYILDAVAPEVKVDLPRNAALDRYLPELGTDSAGRVNRFYIPIELSDALSGVAERGTSKPSQSYLYWVFSSAAALTKPREEMRIRYAVTTSPDEPAAYSSVGVTWYEWAGAYGSERMPLLPVAEKQYLHVALEGLEGLDVTGSGFRYTVYDLAGGNAMGDIRLEAGNVASFTDAAPPAVSVVKNRSAVIDAAAARVRFSVELRLEDVSGIDYTGVAYQWTAQGAPPDENGWVSALPSDPYPGLTSYSGAPRFAQITAETELTGAVKHETELYVRAGDRATAANRGVGGPFPFAINLEHRNAPRYSVQADTETAPRPSLVLDMPAQRVGDNGEHQAQAWVFVRPAVRISDWRGFFDRRTFTEADGLDLFDPAAPANAGQWTDGRVAQMMNGGYYGECYVSVYVGYDLTFNNDATSWDDYVADGDGVPVQGAHYLYKITGNDTMNGPVHRVTVTQIAPPEEKMNSRWNGPWSGGVKYVADIAGLKFDVAIENNYKRLFGLTNWGEYDDVGSAALTVERASESGPEWPGTAVCTVPVTPGVYTEIPAVDGGYPDGRYRFVVDVTRKNGVTESQVHPDVFEKDDFSLAAPEGEEPAEYVAGLTARYTFGAGVLGGAKQYDTPFDETRRFTAGTYVDGTYVTGVEHTLRFDLSAIDAGRREDLFIKVWNATTPALDGVGWENAPWEAVYGEATILRQVAAVAEADVDAGYAYVDDVPHLLVIDGVRNVIRYRLLYANGRMSDVREFVMDVSSQAPELAVAITPERGFHTQVTATVTRAESALGAPPAVYFGVEDGAPRVENGAYDLTDSGVRDGSYTFYAIDDYKNVRFLTVSGGVADTEAPVVVSPPAVMNDGPMYSIQFAVDDISRSEGLEVYYRFDDDYSRRLGLDPARIDDGTRAGYIELAQNDRPYGSWYATAAAATGVYATDHDGGFPGYVDYDGVTLKGVYKFDETLPEGAETTFDMTFVFVDALGHASEETVAVAVKNERTKIESAELRYVPVGEEVLEPDGQWYTGGVPTLAVAVYTQGPPVKIIAPAIRSIPLWYGDGAVDAYEDGVARGYLDRHNNPVIFLNVNRPGTYEMRYADIFGEEYTQTVEIVDDALDGVDVLELDVDMLEIDEQTGRRTVEIRSVKPGERFLVYEGALAAEAIDAGGARDARLLAGPVETFKGSYDPDKKLYITDIADDGDDPAVYFGERVVCYDPRALMPPEVEVHWLYHEFGSDRPPEGTSETNGDVEVWLTSGEEIFPAGGAPLSHVFTYGDARSHTFRYADRAGIAGSVTVTLPVTITPAPPPAPGTAADTEAPRFGLDVAAAYGVSGSFAATYYQ
ncbi:MAG: hypothetical protein LBC26_03555, partial [Oscillospiraceae bacterium]|nr:hypothetical protein [Oscillospiraceae bacterium]